MPPIRRRPYLDVVLCEDSTPYPPRLPPAVTPPTPSGEPSAPPPVELVLQWSPPPSPPPPKKRTMGKNGNHVPKPYTCHLCPMAFQRPSALKQHFNKHTGAKPYLCPDCGAAFAFKTNVARHGRGCPEADRSQGPSPSFASANNK